MDKPKREAILDLAKYVNERIRVKFTGGREGASVCPPPFPAPHRAPQPVLTPRPAAVTGVLKGYDQLLNLVLDEVQENLHDGACVVRKT